MALDVEDGADQLFSVNEIFVSIQGEGPSAGMPAIFIRLAGCNLNCPFCDTKHDVRMTLTTQEIVKAVKCFKNQPQLLVITGGEPFLQPINLLVDALVDNYQIEIETNGTNFGLWGREWNREARINVSPKTETLAPPIYHLATAFKYIICTRTKLSMDGLPHGLARPPAGLPIFLQPMDEKDPVKNQANGALCATLCIQHGYYLSLQLHKIVNIK